VKIQATLNLSEGFGKYGRTIPFKTSKYPAGEVYIKTEVPLGTSTVRINSRCRSSDHLVIILMAVDTLQRQGVKYIELFIPYFPYSRQDRACDYGEAFSLKVIAWMLSHTLDKVITYDVHSDVASSILDLRLENRNNHIEVIDFVKCLNVKGKKLALIVPDAGALKKSQKLFDNTGIFDTLVICHKKRVYGKVQYMDIPDNLNGMEAVVVDDICDGGATFLALSEKLDQIDVGAKHLFVSHGIFSAGMEKLRECYKTIGTTNSMRWMAPTDVKRFNLDY